jgi:hypothetical protein
LKVTVAQIAAGSRTGMGTGVDEGSGVGGAVAAAVGATVGAAVAVGAGALLARGADADGGIAVGPDDEHPAMRLAAMKPVNRSVRSPS